MRINQRQSRMFAEVAAEGVRFSLANQLEATKPKNPSRQHPLNDPTLDAFRFADRKKRGESGGRCLVSRRPSDSMRNHLVRRNDIVPSCKLFLRCTKTNSEPSLSCFASHGGRTIYGNCCLSWSRAFFAETIRRQYSRPQSRGEERYYFLSARRRGCSLSH